MKTKNIFCNEYFFSVDQLIDTLSVKRLDGFALKAIFLVLFVGWFVCCFFFGIFFIQFLYFGFKMFVLVLQLQSKINETYQTHIRFK